MLDQVGQLMIMGLKGKELAADEAEFIVKNQIGGVILFDRNLGSPQEIHKLCSDVQALRHKMKDKYPLFISIDMEGGRVARLKSPFTQWPPAQLLGKLDSTSVAFRFSQAMGEEMRAVGINLDFAPCVDVFSNPKNTVIGDRAFSSDPEQVAKIASAVVRGYIKAGIITCAKHFPGHGNTLIDSHEDLPIEELSLSELDARELIPFKKVFRARIDLVMTAHIHFPKVDAEWPVTLSEKWLQEILRNQLRYRGLIISDDLDMKALAKHHPAEMIPVRALAAGCDIILYCNNAEMPPKALAAVKQAISQNKLSQTTLAASLKRVLDLKKEMLTQPDPAPWSEAAKRIAHPDHLKLAKAIAEQRVPQELLNT